MKLIVVTVAQFCDLHTTERILKWVNYTISELPLNKAIKMLIEPWPCSSVVRASSHYVKVVGSIPGQGTHKNQQICTKWSNKQVGQ